MLSFMSDEEVRNSKANAEEVNERPSYFQKQGNEEGIQSPPHMPIQSAINKAMEKK